MRYQARSINGRMSKRDACSTEDEFSRFPDLETAREKSVDGFDFAWENAGVDVDCARLVKCESGPALGTVGFRQNAKPVEELTPGCVPCARDAAPASTTGFLLRGSRRRGGRGGESRMEDGGMAGTKTPYRRGR